MKNFNPTNSDIKVYPYPMKQGQFEIVKNDCYWETIKRLSPEKKFLLGHISESCSRPRFKGYEKHGGMSAKYIYILYTCNKKSDAHKMEGYLIEQFKPNPNNCNIRSERNFRGLDKIEPYLVYIVLE